jgi:ribosome-interacting GTPase 1
VLCHEAARPPSELDAIRNELALAGIEKPTLVVATKADEADPPQGTLGVSVLDEDSLDELREAIWRLTGLIRIHLRRPGEIEAEAAAFQPPVTVAEAARSIHHELERGCVGARVWGPSARFEGQRVGRGHELAEGDTVEVLTTSEARR